MIWNICQIFIGWMAVDFVSGVYHLILDRFGSPATPILGHQILDFRIHHTNPQRVLDSFWPNNIASLLASLPAFAFAFWAPWFWIPFAIGVLINSETHKACHRARNYWWVDALQWLRIIMPKQAHLKHHRNFNGDYGIVSGWSHIPLNLCVRAMPFLPAPKRLIK